MAHVEWQTPVKGVAIFADGGVGDNGYAHLMGGWRVYFGGAKPLKDRHRKDTIPNIGSTFIGTNSAGSTDAGGSPAAPELPDPT